MGVEKIERGSTRLQRTREEKESTRSSRKVDEAAVLFGGGWRLLVGSLFALSALNANNSAAKCRNTSFGHGGTFS